MVRLSFCLIKPRRRIAADTDLLMLLNLVGSLRGLCVTDVQSSPLILSGSDAVRWIEQYSETLTSLRCGEIVCRIS